MTTQARRSLRLPTLLFSLLSATLALSHAASAAESKTEGLNLGLELRASTDSADIGLPIYPGAIQRKEQGEENKGLAMGFWSNSFGFKLAVQKYSSKDSVDAIARVYLDAMSAYGKPLVCEGKKGSAEAVSKGGEMTASKKDKPLNCEDSSPKPGGRLFKVGTENQQRAVSIYPVGERVFIDLVRIDIKH
ncbi:hypothetical protein DBR47_08055 [Paucibacter sp. KBW04]|uniref:hypothetical protein n=1 Tax=Paucibacter sp. KBW04 TaxID=2153361 RepID=UPI000F55D507|nr:hypothetical protein [Paucibacter sp. KBW04]RQO61175.1 hypothetical protein DBR47_08055 [Paucibacter sp. KBW04]